MSERDLSPSASRLIASTSGRLRSGCWDPATRPDDAVEEAWLRLNRADSDAVENLGGWLTTVIAWVCLDMLRLGNEWSPGA